MLAYFLSLLFYFGMVPIDREYTQPKYCKSSTTCKQIALAIRKG